MGYSILENSSSTGGVIYSLWREMFPRSFHFQYCESALTVEEKSYLSISDNNIRKVITNTQTHTNPITKKQAHYELVLKMIRYSRNYNTFRIRASYILQGYQDYGILTEGSQKYRAYLTSLR